MNLEQWRAERENGTRATLPSGLSVRLKRTSLPDLAEQGQIPQTLALVVEKFVGGKTPKLEDIKASSALIRLVCQACIVGPYGLDVDELDYQDRLAIFNWANEVNKPLTLFRGEQDGAVETPFVVGSVRPTAK